MNALFILLSSLQTIVMGAGIGLIIFIFYSIVSASLNNVKNVINPPKDISRMNNADEVLQLARECLIDNRIEEAKICFKRVVEIDPDHWPAWMMLGNLLFEEDIETSFKGLKIMEQEVQKDGTNLSDDSLKDYALNFYMLGYHYHHNNETAKGEMLKNIAIKNKSFIKDYADFKKKYPY
jgi:tetratricopeptide (TPR) repeat protein